MAVTSPVVTVSPLVKVMLTIDMMSTMMTTMTNVKMMKASPRAQVNRKDNSQYLGKINLIDLAGSENVNKSGVQGPTPRRAEGLLLFD